jgi:hypothetical protein
VILDSTVQVWFCQHSPAYDKRKTSIDQGLETRSVTVPSVMQSLSIEPKFHRYQYVYDVLKLLIPPLVYDCSKPA